MNAYGEICLTPTRLSGTDGMRNDGLVGMQGQPMGMDVETRHKPSGLRYGVVTASTPRMATENASDGQVYSLERTVLGDGFDGILRTSGDKPARRRREW